MAGIMVQTFAFCDSWAPLVGLAEDMATGVVDRFRSLPMAPLRGGRSAVRWRTSSSSVIALVGARHRSG